MTRPPYLSNRIWPWCVYDIDIEGQIMGFSLFLAITASNFVVYLWILIDIWKDQQL